MREEEEEKKPQREYKQEREGAIQSFFGFFDGEAFSFAVFFVGDTLFLVLLVLLLLLLLLLSPVVGD